MQSSDNKREQQSHKKIARHFLENTLKRRYRSSYVAIAEDYHFDISNQSKNNMKRLYQELRNRSYIPEMEIKDYGDKLLNAAESTLFSTFRTLPKTMKHATLHIDFKILKPLDLRLAEKGMIHNAQTGTLKSARQFSYLSFGIGPHHESPEFLSDDAEAIVVELKDLKAQAQRNLQGLWIGNHLQRFIENSNICQVYGTTVRKLIFNEAKMSKTYQYIRQNGAVIERTIQFQDEIFALEQNIELLFDALFFQLINELRLIGGSYQKEIYAKADDPALLLRFFHELFPVSIYPEVRLPRALDLHAPYVAIIKKNNERIAIKAKWFDAIRQGDLTTLQTCLTYAAEKKISLINSRTPMQESGLMVAYDCHHNELRAQTISFLLDHGESIIAEDSHKETVFHHMILKDDLPQFKRFLQLTKILMAHDEVLVMKLLTYACIHGRSVFILEMANVLKQTRFCIPPEEKIVATAFQHLHGREKYAVLKELLALKANINMHDQEGLTALLRAAMVGDLETVQLLVKEGAFINLAAKKDYLGKTALHLACQAHHVQVVNELLHLGADPNALDAFNHTPYSLVRSFLNKEWDEYVEQHQAIFQKELAREIEIKQLLSSRFEQENISHKDVTASFLERKKKDFHQDKNIFVEMGERLESWGAREVAPNVLQDCVLQKLRVVMIVTGEINHERVVLFGRKPDDYTGNPRGFYCFPGGINEMENPESAARRELFEETGLSIPLDVPLREIYRYHKIRPTTNGRTYFETIFFHVDLGDKLSNMRWAGRDDLITVTFVPWSAVKKIIFQIGLINYYYQHIRIRQSNAILAAHVLGDQKLDDASLQTALEIEEGEFHPQFSHALLTNDRAKIADFVHRGLDLNTTTAVAFACQLGQISLIDFLIQYNADVNLVTKTPLSFKTPLLLAITRGQTAVVSHLLSKHHADPNIAAPGISALAVSFSNPNLQDIQALLLSHKLDLNQGIGGSALLATILTKNLHLANRLFEVTHLDCNQSYSFGDALILSRGYPLAIAIQNNAFSFVPLLLSQGASVYVPHHTGVSLFNLLSTKIDMYKRDVDYIQFSKTNKMPSFFSRFEMMDESQDNLKKFGEFAKITELIIERAKSEPHPLYEKEIESLSQSLQSAKAYILNQERSTEFVPNIVSQDAYVSHHQTFRNFT